MSKQTETKDEQSEKPADIKFIKMEDGKVTARDTILRMKIDESQSDAVERLAKDGWNVKDQPFIRQARMLKAVGSRVVGASRNLEVDKPARIMYYDILEAKDLETLDAKVFEKDITFKGTKGPMLVGETKEGTYMGFPIGIIADTMPMESPEEVGNEEQGDNSSSGDEEGD
jgi:hypothetical protein